MPTGTLKIEATMGGEALPVADVSYAIKDKSGNVLFNGLTNENGESEVYTLDAPPKEWSLTPNPPGRPYSTYDVWLGKPGFADINVIDVQIFDGQEAILPVTMLPLEEGRDEEITVIIPPPAVAMPTTETGQIGVNFIIDEHGAPLPGETVEGVPINSRILPDVRIPDYITVHLGTPGNTSAPNTTVRFVDYVKNVTSSEIFSTWPANSIIANVHAIVTFAVNRVYTEWYRARGFAYDITNSTTVDQYFVPGRNIYANISQIVDGIFNVYARRENFKNPYFTEYCNGTTATCKGMSQWGTVTLANRGFTPLQILRNYYPNDLILVTGQTGTIQESYPGTTLAVGSSGESVRRMQLYLNRIAANFPLIPQIVNPNGQFGADTENAVRTFQRTFSLVQDGKVGRSTWNKISQVYTSVTKLAELNSEGQRIGIPATPPNVVLRQGSRGENVLLLQFILDYIATFYSDIPFALQDNIFGSRTAESVRAFQRRFGLTADGVVGPQTWNRLFSVFRELQGAQPPVVTPPIVPPPPSVTPPYPGYLLRQGSSGESVRTLQMLLNNARIQYSAIPLLATDGIFGPLTANAVRTFQRYAGLNVDGIVGPITWAALVAISNA